MENTDNYDKIYGLLLEKNESDSMRVYFIGKIQYYHFYKWMFMHGWTQKDRHPYKINTTTGYKVALVK